MLAERHFLPPPIGRSDGGEEGGGGKPLGGSEREKTRKKTNVDWILSLFLT